MKSTQKAHHSSAETEAAHSTDAIFGPLAVLPDQIDAPAFFVDNNLSIRWTATGGTDPLSVALTRELRSTASRNVFNLLLRPAVKHAIKDWRTFFSFVYENLHHLPVSSSETVATVSSAAPGQASLLQNVDIANPGHRGLMVDSCRIGVDQTARRIFSIAFDKGTLFMIRPLRRLKAPRDPARPASAPQTGSSAPEKKSTCVLSAQLNQSHRLARRMLPELFLILMDRIGDETDQISRSLGGQRARCNGPRLSYVFSENAGRNPIFSAICCATRINNQMALLEEKLQAQYGWTNEIRLNMGIADGADGKPAVDGAPSLAFVIPGGAFDQAILLSRLAAKGEIWITKQAATNLPNPLIDQIVLGADHRGQFVRHFFVQISDLPQIQMVPHKDAEMQTLSVARIKGLER